MIKNIQFPFLTHCGVCEERKLNSYGDVGEDEKYVVLWYCQFVSAIIPLNMAA
jgi:hypothetical protein